MCITQAVEQEGGGPTEVVQLALETIVGHVLGLTSLLPNKSTF